MLRTAPLNEPLPDEIEIIRGRMEHLPLSKASSPRSKHVDLPSRRAAKYARDCGKSHRDEARWQKKEVWRQRDPKEVQPNFVTKYVDRQDRKPDTNEVRFKRKAHGAAKKGGLGGKYTWGSEVADAEELLLAERQGQKGAVLAKLAGIEDPNDPNYGARTPSLSEQLTHGTHTQGQQEQGAGEGEEEEGEEGQDYEDEYYEEEEEEEEEEQQPSTTGTGAEKVAPASTASEHAEGSCPHPGDTIIGGPQYAREHAISGLNKTDIS